MVTSVAPCVVLPPAEPLPLCLRLYQLQPLCTYLGVDHPFDRI